MRGRGVGVVGVLGAAGGEGRRGVVERRRMGGLRVEGGCWRRRLGGRWRMVV